MVTRHAHLCFANIFGSTIWFVPKDNPDQWQALCFSACSGTAVSWSWCVWKCRKAEFIPFKPPMVMLQWTTRSPSLSSVSTVEFLFEKVIYCLKAAEKGKNVLTFCVKLAVAAQSWSCRSLHRTGFQQRRKAFDFVFRQTWDCVSRGPRGRAGALRGGGVPGSANHLVLLWTALCQVSHRLNFYLKSFYFILEILPIKPRHGTLRQDLLRKTELFISSALNVNNSLLLLS